jgi:hypothetical protein
VVFFLSKHEEYHQSKVLVNICSRVYHVSLTKISNFSHRIYFHYISSSLKETEHIDPDQNGERCEISSPAQSSCTKKEGREGGRKKGRQEGKKEGRK